MTLYDEARQMLSDNRELLDTISDALLERETLEGSDLQLLKEGKPLPPLPALVTPDKNAPPPERSKTESTKAFPGDKLPDPEPVPG